MDSPKLFLRKHIVNRLMIAAIIFCAALGLSACSSARLEAYEAYKETPDMRLSFENLGYKDTFEIWNRRDLGNDVNTLLTGGKIYTRNGLKILPDTEDGNLRIEKSDGSVQNLGVKASFLNIMEDMLFYRNDADHHIYSCDLASNQIQLFYEGNAGEVFVTNGLLYFIDFGQDFTLKSISLDGKIETTIINTPVKSFAVCGSHIVYLDTIQNLYSIDINSEMTKHIVSNVERFLIGDKIYAENKDTIISITTDRNCGKQEFMLEDSELRLIGYLDGHLLFQTNGQLRYTTENKIETICQDSYDLYSSVSLDEAGQLYVCTYKKSKDKVLEFNLPFMAAPETGS